MYTSYTPATNSYFANYGQYGLSGLSFNPTYSNYQPTKALNLEYIDTRPYYNYTNNQTSSTTSSISSSQQSQNLSNLKSYANNFSGDGNLYKGQTTKVGDQVSTDTSSSSWGIGDTLGTINAVTGSINAVSGIMSAYQNWEYMKQAIENMNQEYEINQEKFNDYKKDRERLNTMRTNTQKQFSSGSQVKTTY